MGAGSSLLCPGCFQVSSFSGTFWGIPIRMLITAGWPEHLEMNSSRTAQICCCRIAATTASVVVGGGWPITLLPRTCPGTRGVQVPTGGPSVRQLPCLPVPLAGKTASHKHRRSKNDEQRRIHTYTLRITSACMNSCLWHHCFSGSSSRCSAVFDAFRQFPRRRPRRKLTFSNLMHQHDFACTFAYTRVHTEQANWQGCNTNPGRPV